MPNSIIKLAIANAIESGLIVSRNSFAGTVPVTMEKFTLDAGDVLSIPQEVPALGSADNPNAPSFTYVEVRGSDGITQVFRLFPSIFFKSLIDSDGRRHTARGEVYDALKWFRRYDEVMHFLAGREIRVTDVRAIETVDRHSPCLPIIVRRIYDFEFLD